MNRIVIGVVLLVGSLASAQFFGGGGSASVNGQSITPSFVDGGTFRAAGAFESTAASGSDGFNCLTEGCRHRVGPDTYLYESGTQMILAAASSLVSGLLVLNNDLRPQNDGVIDIGTTGLRIRTMYMSGLVNSASTDSSGSPGAATISKPGGRSAIASGATSVVITNTLVAATSHVFIAPQGRDATCLVPIAVPAAGSFTVSTTGAACTGNLIFDWFVTAAH